MSKPLPIFPSAAEFTALVAGARAQHPTSVLAIPIVTRLLADQLTPVLAYRRLVAADEREAPSFLFESVEGGERQGRYSILGAHPVITVTATRETSPIAKRIEMPSDESMSASTLHRWRRREGDFVQIDDLVLEVGTDLAIFEVRAYSSGILHQLAKDGDRIHPGQILGTIGDAPSISQVNATVVDNLGISDRVGTFGAENPLALVRGITSRVQLVKADSGRRSMLPASFLGGWVGYAAYDTVRYVEGASLQSPPPDDRNLPELSFGFYDGAVIFDNVDKLVSVVQLAIVKPTDDPARCLTAATAKLQSVAEQIQRHSKPLNSGAMTPDTARTPAKSNLSTEQHAAMVAKAKEYIKAGDIFQVVLGQRFERTSKVDPFDVYRALRAVNPSPYLVYLQAAGSILVASSPEILCRVRKTGTAFTVTNRPLAGTRKRGSTAAEDLSLEKELLADPKERAEHIMLVDLGRNDVGIVSKAGTVQLPALMEIERYSHVMHISSTVTGELREGLDCWDALAAALPVGTISGAPKVRAMQIIDELEPMRRGPYGGGIGYVGLDGQMDIALALRTIVVPLSMRDAATNQWTYHMQASGGIVADSDPHMEYMETVNKAAALAAAIDVAESAFLD